MSCMLLHLYCRESWAECVGCQQHDLYEYTLLEETHARQWRSIQWAIFDFSPPTLQLTWMGGNTHGMDLYKMHRIPGLCPKHSQTWNETSPGTTCVLGNGQGLMQATELWTSILIGILWSPRAHPVLMCAASWTAATQPGQQCIPCESKACRPSTGLSLMNTQELHEQHDKERNKLHFLVKPSNPHKIHYLYIMVEAILKFLDTAQSQV